METPNRREFIKTTAATAAALVSGRLHPQPAAQTVTAPSADPLVLELANEALNAARSGGASYADVRVGRYRRQDIHTRERQVTAVADDESYGHRHPHARERVLGIRRHKHDDASRRAECRARRH